MERWVFLRGTEQIFSQFQLGVFLNIFPAISRSPHYVVYNLISRVIQAPDSHGYIVSCVLAGYDAAHSTPYSPGVPGVVRGFLRVQKKPHPRFFLNFPKKNYIQAVAAASAAAASPFEFPVLSTHQYAKVDVSFRGACIVQVLNALSHETRMFDP